VAIVIAVISLIAVIYYNLLLAGIYLLILAVSFLWFKVASYRKAQLEEKSVIIDIEK